MTEATRDTIDPGAAGGFGALYTGAKHLRIPFITNTVDPTSSETFSLDTGSSSDGAIVMAAWEPVNTSDPAAVTIGGNRRQITFTGATSGINGYLHIWMTN